MSEEEKVQVVAEKPTKEKKVPLEKRFNEFQEQTTNALGTILELLQNKAPTPAAAEVQKMVEEGSADDQTPTPPAWIKAVHQILGPEFECELVQPNNGGTLFKIIVPMDKSNTSQLYRQMHKRDIRTREIGNSGLSGVKEWCLRVRANLVASGVKLVQYP